MKSHSIECTVAIAGYRSKGDVLRTPCLVIHDDTMHFTTEAPSNSLVCYAYLIRLAERPYIDDYVYVQGKTGRYLYNNETKQHQVMEIKWGKSPKTDSFFDNSLFQRVYASNDPDVMLPAIPIKIVEDIMLQWNTNRSIGNILIKGEKKVVTYHSPYCHSKCDECYECVEVRLFAIADKFGYIVAEEIPDYETLIRKIDEHMMINKHMDALEFDDLCSKYNVKP